MMKNKDKSIQSQDANPRAKADPQAVPPGYKRTEAGVIPEDWNHVYLGDIANVKGGKRLPAGSSLLDTPTPYPYIRVSDMYEGGVDLSEIKYVPEEAFPAIRNYRIYHRDIFISVAGTLGIVGIVPPELDGANLTENADRITDLKCDRDYLKYWLMSEPIQKMIVSIRTVGAQPKLALERILKFSIAIPKEHNEQRAIAEALSDVDGLIEALEKLIAKKRAVKQAAMQQLLTGKTRLPGFQIKPGYKKTDVGVIPEDWEVKRLGDIALIKKGELITRANIVPGLIPVVAGGKQPAYFHNQANRYGKTITISASGAYAGYVALWEQPIFASDCSTISEGVDYSIMFIYYQLVFKQDAIYRAQTGGAQPHVHPHDLRPLPIVIPSNNEQQAIAAVLSDMDAEIESLERRREKVKKIKQGMMQQLLTGRIRLVKPQESAAQTDKQSQKTKGHSWAFNEAVVISVLAKHFGNMRFPLGRKRYTKLSYLLHRYTDKNVEGYLKKAAGPYNPKTKYGGPERIALEKGYIREHKRGRYEGFVAADNIAEAEDYFDKWYGLDCIQWLEQFRFKKNDELELLATVDMAVEELQAGGKDVNVKGVKDVIRSHPEWKAKLKSPVFSDVKIAETIKKLHRLFEAR